jgi:hypothetical protein
MLRLLLALTVLSVAACTNHAAPSPDATSTPPDTTMRPIEEVLAAHTDSLMAIEGVSGVGQALCDEQPCLRVYVHSRTPAVENQLPDQLEGYLIEVVETGQITPLPANGQG